MNQRLISEIGRTQRLDIINSLKRTKGMSVNELVEKMGMSYMGIKQHCITLHRRWSIALRAARTIFSMPTATSSRWTC
jgi:predicted ArsR family transcriptional regulator